MNSLPVPIILNLYGKILPCFEIIYGPHSCLQFCLFMLVYQYTVTEKRSVLNWESEWGIFVAVFRNHFPNVWFNIYPNEIKGTILLWRSYEREILGWSTFWAPYCLFIIYIVPVVAISKLIEIYSLCKITKAFLKIINSHKENSSSPMKSIVQRVYAKRHLRPKSRCPTSPIIYIPFDRWISNLILTRRIPHHIQIKNGNSGMIFQCKWRKNWISMCSSKSTVISTWISLRINRSCGSHKRIVVLILL